jgi:hypothetical protein
VTDLPFTAARAAKDVGFAKDALLVRRDETAVTSHYGDGVDTGGGR